MVPRVAGLSEHRVQLEGGGVAAGRRRAAQRLRHRAHVVRSAAAADADVADAGEHARARERGAAVVAMLDVLGLNPADPAWATGGSDDRLTEVVDALVKGLLEERTAAREAKDWARADAIRDRIKAAGLEIEDTSTGPRWTIVLGSV